MSIRDFWSITGNQVRDAYLLVPIAALVIATMWTQPAGGKASTAFYVVIVLDVIFLGSLIIVWLRHLFEMRNK
jgi:hypothetical protein